ncbi:MAG: hypothetical protein SVK08_01955 [Halobacteriota archaeon]|nr:hypothetical protein [Halobacteriota archaeon]
MLPKGTALALDKSANSSGLIVPYSPTTFAASASEYVTGRAYLVADVGAGANVVYVNVNDSYKFAVGDDLIINDNATAVENLGAITAIDRTTYNHMAAITATTTTSGTFETSAYGYVIVEAGTSGNNYSDCVGILEKSVDTGKGSKAKGAVATMIIGNCVLYEGVLINMDAAAKTDISAASFGQYLYIR